MKARLTVWTHFNDPGMAGCGVECNAQNVVSEVIADEIPELVQKVTDLIKGYALVTEADKMSRNIEVYINPDGMMALQSAATDAKKRGDDKRNQELAAYAEALKEVAQLRAQVNELTAAKATTTNDGKDF